MEAPDTATQLHRRAAPSYGQTNALDRVSPYQPQESADSHHPPEQSSLSSQPKEVLGLLDPQQEVQIATEGSYLEEDAQPSNIPSTEVGSMAQSKQQPSISSIMKKRQQAPPVKKVRYQQPIAQCALCFRNLPQAQLLNLASCSHLLCSRCTQGYVRQRLSSFEQVRCPGRFCRAELRQFSFSFLTQQETNVLKKIHQGGSKLSLDKNAQAKFETVETEKQLKGEELQIEFEIETTKQNDKERTEKSQTVLKNSGTKRKRVQIIEEPLYLIPVNTAFRETNRENINRSPYKNFRTVSAASLRQLSTSKSLALDIEWEQSKLQLSGYFPAKMFAKLCEGVWSNRWSKFVLMLPLSLLLLVVFLASTLVWLTCIFLYFFAAWCLFVPVVWSVVEISRCFRRSFPSYPVLRKLLLGLSLLCFPMLIVFFYLLTLGIILYSGYYRSDMSEIARGRLPDLLRAKATYLKQRKNKTCDCVRTQQCNDCRVRDGDPLCGCLVL